jgi:hypothetical protein
MYDVQGKGDISKVLNYIGSEEFVEEIGSSCRIDHNDAADNPRKPA